MGGADAGGVRPAGQLTPQPAHGRVFELLEAVDASYDAVVAKLPKRDRLRSG